MPLSASDVRFTVRRAADRDPQVYPRLLKDRAILTSIDVALQYFETMLGEQRRALDPEALVHFFGDYKVARGMVAAIGRTYRYRTPAISEIVSRTAWGRLQRAGVERPGALRVLLWDAANVDRAGFLDGAHRIEVVGGLEARFGLRPGQLDRLVALDALEHAILGRLGQRPSPTDILAEYRRSVVAALLTHSERVELTLDRAAATHLDSIKQLAEVERVDVDLVAEAGGGRVAVRGQTDAFGSLARQGRRVARFVARLVERCGPGIDDGAAIVLVRGRRGRLRLSGDPSSALNPSVSRTILFADGWESPSGWDDAAIWSGIGPGQPSVPGWLVRRDPEPRAWAAGALTPDLLVRPAGGDAMAGTLVCLIRTAAQAVRLAGLLPEARGGEPILCAGPDPLLEPLRAAGCWTVELTEPALAPIVAVAAARTLADAPLRPLRSSPTAERRRRRVA